MDFTQLRSRIQKVLHWLNLRLDHNDCILCQSRVEQVLPLRLLCPTCYQDLERWPLGHDILRDNPNYASDINHQHFDGLCVIGHYRWPFSYLIQRLKYHKQIYLSEPLALLLEEQIRYAPWPAIDYICPLPLHSKRYYQRGYNQAALLTLHIGRQLAIPELRSLKRKKNTLAQAKLNRRQRLNNIKDAFHCHQDLTGKTILLVDDVITTGSTLDQASCELKRCGAHRVLAAALTIRPLRAP